MCACEQFSPASRRSSADRSAAILACSARWVVEVHTGVFTNHTALALLQRITDEESWLAEQAERARTNRIFVALPMFVVAAQG